MEINVSSGKGVAIWNKTGQTFVYVNKSGNINVKKNTNALCCCDIPIFRGMFYFINEICLLFALILNQNQINNVTELFEPKLSENVFFVNWKAIFSVLIVCCFGVVCFVVFLVFPELICNIFKINLFKWQFFTKTALRIISFVFLIFLLGRFGFFLQTKKFNTALSYVCKSFFWEFCFLTFLILIFVLSLISEIKLGLWTLLISIIFLIITVGISYEIFIFMDGKNWNNKIITVFTKATPNATERIIANVAFYQKDKMETKNINAKNMIATSVVMGYVKEKLCSANIQDPSEVDWLVAGVLNCNRTELKLINQISDDSQKQIYNVVKRRMTGEPLTKIFGFADFFCRRFQITADVLSPRPETELLAEQVIKCCTKNTKILDLCTGSGVIAITINLETKSKVTATDISQLALEIAKKNAKILGANIKFVKSNMFLNVQKKYNIIVSNPPYIPSKQVESLDVEVKNYDPIIALDGGEDGLEFYKEIANNACNYLTNNGQLFLEIGDGQAKSVKKLLQKNFEDIKIIKDYFGKQRIIICKIKINRIKK
ncbi:MAG: peptide chain release factor N(5)-glutamine methyltransferase [Clostridia bacterium]